MLSFLKKKYKEIYSGFMALLMLAQSFVPAFFVFTPSNVYASSDPILFSEVELSLNNDNEFDLSVESSEDVEYLITYSDEFSETEKAIKGVAVSDGSEAKVLEFAGVCSSDNVCVEDNVVSGKLSFADNNFDSSFVVVDDQLWLTKDDSSKVNTVELGKVYSFPLDNEVQITFTKLPENPGNLTIQKVELTQEQVKQVGAATNIAYDITSSMENGSFEYDLKLLVPGDSKQNSQVVYAENLFDLDNAQELEEEVTGNEVVVNGLDHFTVFVLVQPQDMATSIADVYADSDSWFFYNDETDVIDNSLGSFVSGPDTAPYGAGSVQISVSGTQRRNLATYQFSGTPLADITELGFSTYNPSIGNGGSSNRTGYLNFNVDFDGSDTWQRRLIFTPPSGDVQQDTWQAWDAIDSGNALWHYSGSNWPVTGEPGSTSKTWNDILTDYPGVRVRVNDSWMGIRVGSPYSDGYTENIDAFVFGTAAGTTIYNFDPDVVPPAKPTWGTVYTGHGVDSNNEIGCGAVTNTTQVTFEWNTNSESDLAGYWFGTKFNPKHQWFDAGSTVKTANMTPGNNPYYYTIIAVDNDGNESEPSDHCDLTLDQDAPEIPVQTGYNENNGDSYSVPRPVNELTCTGDVTNINGVSVHWTDVSNSSSVIKYQRQYRVGTGSWSGNEVYTQPYTNYRTFGGGLGNEGTYGSRVRAWKDYDNDNVVDANEMASDWSNECSITFDRTAPATPTGLKRLGIDGSEYSCSDLSVRQNMVPMWDENGESDFDHYEYSSFHANGSQGLNEKVLYTNSLPNTWVAPEDGTYGFAVRAVDKAGNKSDWALTDETWAGSCQITYDSTAPTITLDAPTQDSVIAGDIALQATCDEECDYVNFWWRKEDQSYSNVSPDRRYHYEHTNGTTFNWTLDSLNAELWGGDPSYVMSDGTYYFYAAGKDVVGNWAKTSEVKIVVDNTAPTATIDSIKYSNGTEESSKFVTNYSDPVILGTASDNNSVASVELSINGHTYLATLTGSDWEANVTDVIPDGLYDMTVTVTDTAGNVITETQSIRIDTSAPTATYKQFDGTTEVTGTKAYVNDLSRLSFTGEYLDTDPSSNLYWDSYVIFEAQDDGSFAFSSNGKQSFCGWRSAPNLVDISGGSTFSLTTPQSFTNCEPSLADGEYYMAHHVYDTATRKDIPSINQFRDVLGLNFVVDTVEPESAITTYGLADGGEIQTATFSGLIEGTATDGTGSGIDHVLLSISHLDFGASESATTYWDATSSAWLSTESMFRANGTDSWDYQLTDVPEGIYNVTSHAVDLAGNVESTYTIKIVYDKTIPEVVLTIDPASPDASNGWYKTNPTITLTDSDNYKKDYIEYQWNTTTDGNWTKYVGPFNPPGEGQNILYYRGVDFVGNYATEATAFGIKEVKYDATSPTDGPLNVRVENIGSSTATGKWEKPENSDVINEYKLSWKHKDTGTEYSATVGSGTFEHELDNLFDGLWEFKVAAVDHAGHSKTSSTDFRVGPEPDSGEAVLGVTTQTPPTFVGTPGLVAGVNTEETEEAENKDVAKETEETKNNGEVAGVSDTCETWQFYLPLILLILQTVMILAIEVINRKASLKKILMVVGLSLLSIVLFSWLRNSGCYSDKSMMGFLSKYFIILSLSLSVLLKFASSISIEDK